MKNATRNARFQSGTACYTCAVCGKRTRDTGRSEADTGLCYRCFTIAGLENQHSDNGPEYGHPGMFGSCATCLEALKQDGIELTAEERALGRWCDHAVKLGAVDAHAEAVNMVSAGYVSEEALEELAAWLPGWVNDPARNHGHAVGGRPWDYQTAALAFILDAARKAQDAAEAADPNHPLNCECPGCETGPHPAPASLEREPKAGDAALAYLNLDRASDYPARAQLSTLEALDDVRDLVDSYQLAMADLEAECAKVSALESAVGHLSQLISEVSNERDAAIRTRAEAQESLSIALRLYEELGDKFRPLAAAQAKR